MKKINSVILIVPCLLACFIISACSNNAAKSANATPTTAPTTVPTAAPTTVPATVPTAAPTTVPTIVPTAAPTILPTASPATTPVTVPATVPTTAPTTVPTAVPTAAPTTAATVASTVQIGQGEQNEDTTGNVPPPMLHFDSQAEIAEYVSAKSVKSDVGKKFANNYSTATVFGNKSDILCDYFGGVYYADRNELDLMYTIKGINYRFIYRFGADVLPQFEGEPVLQDVRLGQFVFDLYQGTGDRLVGSIMDGETEIRIIVRTEQVSDIDFSAFTLFTLGDGSLSE